MIEQLKESEEKQGKYRSQMGIDNRISSAVDR
jgi:hypothetical protein